MQVRLTLMLQQIIREYVLPSIEVMNLLLRI